MCTGQEQKEREEEEPRREGGEGGVGRRGRGPGGGGGGKKRNAHSLPHQRRRNLEGRSGLKINMQWGVSEGEGCGVEEGKEKRKQVVWPFDNVKNSGMLSKRSMTEFVTYIVGPKPDLSPAGGGKEKKRPRG